MAILIILHILIINDLNAVVIFCACVVVFPFTTIFYLFKGGCPVCVRQLLKFGEDIDAVAGDGATAIVHAC